MEKNMCRLKLGLYTKLIELCCFQLFLQFKEMRSLSKTIRFTTNNISYLNSDDTSIVNDLYMLNNL